MDLIITWKDRTLENSKLMNEYFDLNLISQKKQFCFACIKDFKHVSPVWFNNEIIIY